MTTGISRERALALLREHMKGENMMRHSLAAEAVMGRLALHLGQDKEKWAMAGLLHDLDVEITRPDLSDHGLKTVEILEGEGVDPEIVEAIRLHNELAHSDRRSSPFHHALAAGETMTGLITATALVYPDRRLSSVKVKSITKRMKERAFAASVNREIILECERIGIPLEEFARLSLEAMQAIGGELGL